MADSNFVVKNGLVANGSFTANSTQFGITSAVVANTTTISIGTATINSTSYTGTANNTLYVGSVSAANVVSNAQLSANLANYQTTAGLAANVAVLAANNAAYLGGTAAASYQLNSTLSANVAKLTANNASYAFGKSEGALNVNNASYAFGKSEGALNVNSASMATGSSFNIRGGAGGEGGEISLGYANNSAGTWFIDVDSSNNFRIYSIPANNNVIMHAVFSDTGVDSIIASANNALYLGGVAASGYQNVSSLAASVAPLNANNASYLGGTAASGYQTTAGLSANVAKLTANNASYLGGTAASGYAKADIANTVFHWSEYTSGQPAWVWVGQDSVQQYVYNPTKLNVNSAVYSTYLNGKAESSLSVFSASSPVFTDDSSDITSSGPNYRLATGFYQSSNAQTANGWPVSSNGWYHLISATHNNDSNYYALQLASSFYGNDLYFRSTNGSGSTAWSRALSSDNYNSYAPTLTGTGASGTWNITANNASYLGGTAASGYQTTAGLSANVATMAANNANYLGGTAASGYQTTAGLSANVAKLTANNSTYLNGVAAANYARLDTNDAFAANVTIAVNKQLVVGNTAAAYGIFNSNTTVAQLVVYGSGGNTASITPDNISAPAGLIGSVAGGGYTFEVGGTAYISSSLYGGNAVTAAGALYSGYNRGADGTAALYLNSLAGTNNQTGFVRSSGAAGALTLRHAGNGTFSIITNATSATAGGTTAMTINYLQDITVPAGNFAVTGAITATGNITAYYSDKRLKKDLKYVAEEWKTIIDGLTPYWFKWNDTALDLMRDKDTKTQIGFIAQDVQKVLPQAVTEQTATPADKVPDDGQYLTIMPEKIIPVLVAAVKDLTAEIEILKAELAKLKGK